MRIHIWTTTKKSLRRTVWVACGMALVTGALGAVSPTTSALLKELTPAGSQWLKQRVTEHVKAKTTAMLRVKELLHEGVNPENDAIERAITYGGEQLVPYSIAFAEPLSVEAAAPKTAVDPAIETTIREALRLRLGREPRGYEVQGEVHAYDQRIAKLNAAIAANKAAFAAAYKKTGRAPRALEARLLGTTPGGEAADDPAYADAMRRLLSRLVNDAASRY
jgi:hypothetical protein